MQGADRLAEREDERVCALLREAPATTGSTSTPVCRRHGSRWSATGGWSSLDDGTDLSRRAADHRGRPAGPRGRTSGSRRSASPRAARAVPDRRPLPGRRGGLGGRRLHRRDAVHPRRQVPGAGGDRRHARAPGDGRLHGDPAGDLHRPRGRRRRHDRGGQAREAGHDVASSAIDLPARSRGRTPTSATPRGELGLIAGPRAPGAAGGMGGLAAGQRVDPSGGAGDPGADRDRRAASDRGAVPVVLRGVPVGAVGAGALTRATGRPAPGRRAGPPGVARLPAVWRVDRKRRFGSRWPSWPPR